MARRAKSRRRDTRFLVREPISVAPSFFPAVRMTNAMGAPSMHNCPAIELRPIGADAAADIESHPTNGEPMSHDSKPHRMKQAAGLPRSS